MDEMRRRRALAELRPHIERARQFSGWEFGALRVRPVTPGPPWDYEAIARKRALRAERGLDMGTGGGEVLSRIAADLPVQFVATEHWQINAPIARDRLAPCGIEIVRCDSLRLPIRAATFDLVLSRHEALDPAEVVRVLRTEGRVVTQQVGRKQLYELRRFFPRMTDFGDQYGMYARAFEAAGLTVHAREHDWKVAYATLGDLVFLLMVTPWSFPGFDPEREIDTLLAVEEAFGSAEGIVLTEHRYLIMAEHDR